MASYRIIIDAAFFVVVENILQGDVVKIISNNLAESLPQRQRDAFVAILAADWLKVQAGDRRDAAFSEAQDAANCVFARLLH